MTPFLIASRIAPGLLYRIDFLERALRDEERG